MTEFHQLSPDEQKSARQLQDAFDYAFGLGRYCAGREVNIIFNDPPPKRQPISARPFAEGKRELMLQALRQHRGNVSNAAKFLGISRNTIKTALGRKENWINDL